MLGYEEPTGLRWEVRKINRERIKNKKQKRHQHDVDVESHPDWEDYRLRVLVILRIILRRNAYVRFIYIPIMIDIT